MKRRLVSVAPCLIVLLFTGAIASAQQPGAQTNAVLALHAGPVVAYQYRCPGPGAQDPNTLGIACSDYNVNEPAPGASVLYLVVAKGESPGIVALSCGIDYDSLAVSWQLCSDGLEFPADGGNGPWPAPGGGNRITWITCQTTVIGSDGMHAVAGAFYVNAYGDDRFVVTPNNALQSGPEATVTNCAGYTTDIIDNPRGAVGFGSRSGINPCCLGSLIRVPGDYATIQEAIDAAVCDGDTVLVSDGTYADALDRNLDFDGKHILLLSENGPASTVIDCASSGYAMVFQNGETNATVVDGFTVRNASSSAIICIGASPTIRNCVVEDCASPSAGGALSVSTSAYPVVTDCVLRNNTGTQNGGAVAVNGASLDLTDCSIQGNSTGSLGGAVYALNSGTVTLLRCLIAGNAAGSLGGGIYANNSPLSLTDCTVTANDGALGGGGIRLLNAASVATLTRTILIDNCADAGEDMSLSVSAAANFFCSVLDISRLDVDGTSTYLYDVDSFLTDPLFCAPEPCSSAPTTSGEYTLHEESLCLAAASPCFQLIGARDQGCGYGISDIADVGNDQGRQVRIRWNRSGQDRMDASVPVTFYSIWRRVAAALSPGLNPLLAGTATKPLAFPPGDWEFVQSVPASAEPKYITIAPTLCDSTSAGMCRSTFLVRAQTGQPALYYDTAPDSGYSVDNLAPAAPLNLLLTAGALAWDEAPEADFNYFTVYGSEEETLGPSATLIDHTVAPTLDVSAAPFAYYHVTATDFAGNEGLAATASSSVSAPEPELPAMYALRQCRPNPYRSTTRIEFDLPHAGPARLQVFDVTGRLVRTLVDSPLEGGRYSVPWLGRDDAGRTVPPGIYFYRLESGPFRRTMKAVRIG